MSSLTDWSDERFKCWSSEITFKYPAGEMMVDFRTYVKYHRYGKNAVKRLLKLSNARNRAVMLKTIDVLIDEIKSEYKQVMDDAQKQIDEIENKFLFPLERENAKKPIRKKCNAKRKSLNAAYEKLLDLKTIIGEVV